VNFTTMNRDLQNAYSVQTSFEVERQLTTRTTVSAGYQRMRGLTPDHVDQQNAPACVAAGTNNGCRPNAGYANNSQYNSAADSNYNALHVSFMQRPSRWGHYRISYAWSKAMDNVGEFFFSSPIDTRNIWLDYGRSDDDQRHRVVFDGAVHSHGFQLSGMLQYYSALPFNITSGVTTVQGTTGRPIVNGEFIPRNAGTGNDFFSVSARLSRTFRIGDRVTLEGMAEAFNALNHRNNLTRNGVFGAGRVPVEPVAHLRTSHRRERPAQHAARAAHAVLTERRHLLTRRRRDAEKGKQSLPPSVSLCLCVNAFLFFLCVSASPGQNKAALSRAMLLSRRWASTNPREAVKRRPRPPRLRGCRASCC
jgi:hypothetical protein